MQEQGMKGGLGKQSIEWSEAGRSAADHQAVSVDYFVLRMSRAYVGTFTLA